MRIGLTGLVQSVQLATLVENRGLGRVQVLGLAIAEQASTKADDTAAGVENREDNAVTQAVVGFAILLLGDQAGVGQPTDPVFVGAQRGQQPVPPRWGISEPKPPGDLAAAAAAAQILDRSRRVGMLAQLVFELPGRLLQHVVDRAMVGSLFERCLARDVEPER